MSIYADLRFADNFYGSDDFGNPPGGPANLNAYQNNITSVVLYWALNPPSANIHSFVWTVQTDTVDTFTSPDLLTYVTTDPGVSFIEGRVHKGVAVPVYPRLQGETKPMYWRVMGSYGGSDTLWSSSVFDIPQAIDEVVRDAELGLMPDPIYKKDSSSNNYKTHWVFGKAIDDHYVGDVFAENDICIDLVRDISLQGKFGDMVRILRPQAMMAIDFREVIRQFYAEARMSPTVRSVRNMVRACLCEEPAMTPIRDTLDLYVADDTVGQEVVGFWVEDVAYPSIIPATIWDNIHLAGGIIVEVTNAIGAIVSKQFLQTILRKLILANFPLYVSGIP